MIKEPSLKKAKMESRPVQSRNSKLKVYTQVKTLDNRYQNQEPGMSPDYASKNGSYQRYLISPEASTDRFHSNAQEAFLSLGSGKNTPGVIQGPEEPGEWSAGSPGEDLRIVNFANSSIKGKVRVEQINRPLRDVIEPKSVSLVKPQKTRYGQGQPGGYDFYFDVVKKRRHSSIAPSEDDQEKMDAQIRLPTVGTGHGTVAVNQRHVKQQLSQIQATSYSLAIQRMHERRSSIDQPPVDSETRAMTQPSIKGSQITNNFRIKEQSIDVVGQSVMSMRNALDRRSGQRNQFQQVKLTQPVVFLEDKFSEQIKIRQLRQQQNRTTMQSRNNDVYSSKLNRVKDVSNKSEVRQGIKLTMKSLQVAEGFEKFLDYKLGKDALEKIDIRPLPPQTTKTQNRAPHDVFITQRSKKQYTSQIDPAGMKSMHKKLFMRKSMVEPPQSYIERKKKLNHKGFLAGAEFVKGQGHVPSSNIVLQEGVSTEHLQTRGVASDSIVTALDTVGSDKILRVKGIQEAPQVISGQSNGTPVNNDETQEFLLKPIVGPRQVAMRSMKHSKAAPLKHSGGSYFKIEPTHSKRSASRQGDPSTLKQEDTIETKDGYGMNSSAAKMGDELVEIGDDFETEADAVIDYKFVKSYRKKMLETIAKPPKLDQTKKESIQKRGQEQVSKSIDKTASPKKTIDEKEPYIKTIQSAEQSVTSQEILVQRSLNTGILRYFNNNLPNMIAIQDKNKIEKTLESIKPEEQRKEALGDMDQDNQRKSIEIKRNTLLSRATQSRGTKSIYSTQSGGPIMIPMNITIENDNKKEQPKHYEEQQTDFHSDFVTRQTSQGKTEQDRIMMGQDQVDSEHQQEYTAQALPQTLGSQFHDNYANQLKKTFMKQFLYYKRDQMMKPDDLSKRLKRSSASQKSEEPDSPTVRRQIMEEFIKRYKPKEVEEKPIDPRHILIGPNGLTLCKVCDADRLSDPNFLKSLSKKARAQLKSDCKCLTPQQRYDVAQAIRTADRIIYQKQQSKKTAEQRVLEAYNIESVDPKSLAPYLFCEFLKHKKGTFQMREQRERIIKDLQNRQLLVLDTAMKGIDKEISQLTKSLQDGIEEKDIETDFDAHEGKGTFLERQVIGDMNHLEENALKKYDVEDSNQKGVKFELMEEIVGSMKHKSQVYDKIEGLKLKKEALEQERINIITETDFNVLSGFMPRAHAILSPTRVHEPSDGLNLSKQRFKEHHEIIPQINFHLKELVDKHKDELFAFTDAQKDKPEWSEKDIWGWIRKSYAKQQQRAKKVGLDIQGVYQASLILPLESILEEMMPVKGQIRNIGDKYFAQGSNLFENEKYQQIQKLRVGDPGLVTEKQTITQIFSQEIKKEKFFKQAKRGKLVPKEDNIKDLGQSSNIVAYNSLKVQSADVSDSKDPEYLAQKEMQDYFDICVKYNITPILSLVAIKNHKLLYIEDNISEDEAMVIRDFLLECDIKTNPKNIVKELIVVDCGMSDECLSYILEGLLSQQYHSKVKNETFNYLETFVYKNNSFGSKSMPLLQKMMPNLFQFCMTNVDGLGQHDLAELLEGIALTQKQNIQKLQISQIPVKHDVVMDKFAYIFQEKDSLCHLDISQAYMDPKAFSKMVRDVILPGKKNLKHLNLSENKLNYQTEASREHSSQIVDDLCEFFKDNDKLVHLDISGMGFSHKEGQLLKICEVISESCDNLLAIHINDTQIRGDEDLFDEILDLFGIKSNPPRHQASANHPVVNPYLLQDVVQMHTNPVPQDQVQNQTSQIDAEEYKKRLILSKNSKKVQMDRLLNQLERAAGVGRQEITVDDNFILNRKVNFPELIFNQDERQDKYFESDFSRKWQLLEPNFKNGCYVCQKHKYTMIQYDQRINSETFETFGNKDLIEICPWQIVESKSKGKSQHKKQRSHEQQAKVDEIKRALISEDVSRQTVPFICGTVVNGTAYTRKLKMLRMDLFSLLTLSQSHQFSDKWKQTKTIKRGVDCIVSKEVDQRLFFKIGDKDPLEHYDQIIHDKCFRNEITDVESINVPKQKSYSESEDSMSVTGNEFGYATFLPPGVHNFLIYCPKTDRLFCKEVVVDLNSKDFYPELPRMPSTNKRKTMANIWREHRQDNLDKQLLNFNAIVNQSDSLASGSPQFLGAQDNEDELSKCSQVLVEYFEQLKNLFIELAGKSKSYPEVNGDLIQDYFLRQNNSQDEHFQKPVTTSMINSCIKAITKQDLEEATLTQGQFIEIILRLAKATAPCSSTPVSQWLPQFLQFYLINQYESLDVIAVRNKIRDSKQLNSLLLKNKMGLRRIFNEFKDASMGEKEQSFTISSCNEIINLGINDQRKRDAPEVDPVINQPMLQRAFVFSKMGLNTPKDVRQIKFVEFLEFLCRSALIISGAKEQTKVEVEVQNLLQKIFDYLWEKKRFVEAENDPELITQELDDEESSDQ